MVVKTIVVKFEYKEWLDVIKEVKECKRKKLSSNFDSILSIKLQKLDINCWLKSKYDYLRFC
jgi:hypothetical protein